jgi:2'-5' RNA ligase
MSNPVRFIIITVLPKEVARRFDEARRSVCEIGGSQAALAYPPHVTLRTGALVPGESVDAFLTEFGETVGRWDPFPMATEGLLVTDYRDGERRKYLVGYQIRKDPELVILNERLLRYEKWRASNRLHFEPHLTLAFDDLTEEGIQRVRLWLDENPSELPVGLQWSCDNVSLYKRHGDRWTLHREWRARIGP